jgi:peroxiredoxin
LERDSSRGKKERKEIERDRFTRMSIVIGSPAPSFELSDQNGNKVSLASFKGEKNVVLLFYPFAFTGTCTGELCALRDDLAQFQNDDVQLLAVSCDSMFTQRIFAEKEGYEFPVLADFWPHGAVAQSYGIFDEARGCALRGTFIIDKEGIVRWQVVNGLGDARNLDDYRTALAAL